jgi:hypothetical protein
MYSGSDMKFYECTVWLKCQLFEDYRLIWYSGTTTRAPARVYIYIQFIYLLFMLQNLKYCK